MRAQRKPRKRGRPAPCREVDQPGAGVPVPAYRVADNATDVESAAAEIGLPVILKPIVGGGSSGVRLCRNVDELAEHTAAFAPTQRKWQSSPRILVEEFAQGPHFIVLSLR
ncbi:MAG: ATP-grasp domain-containing protein [Mesorhizobium sp.]|nr:MAG: ATP-grasp domain-containing protein [Mesorhizobium sp.]